MIKYSICIIKLSTHIYHKCDIAYLPSLMYPSPTDPGVSGSESNIRILQKNINNKKNKY